MADPTQTPFGFRIRRVDEPARPAARPAPVPTPEPTPEPLPAPPAVTADPESPPDAPPVAPPRSEQAQPKSAATGARFPTPGRVLAFIGALAGSGLVQEVLCRRGPEGGWWVETDQPTRDLVHLIWTTGGRPYARPAGTQPPGSGAWQPLDLDGEPTGPALDADAWPQVELPQLLAGTGLRPCIPVSANTLYLAVPAALSRWALKRALALGLTVGIRCARARPLGEDGSGEDAASSLLILRLCAGRREVPHALARALAALPYATLAQSVGTEEGRLLVDVAYRAPLGDSLLGDLVPPGATWLLAGPETGHRALTMDGEELDAASLLEAPALVPGTSGLTPGGDGTLPAPLPVRLVHVAGRHDPIDALLLDDTELDWTRGLLMGRPLAERAFLLPGAGRHLLLVGAAGGLAADLPFGTPLTAAGPGGLFLEAGLIFRPALPDGARRKALGLDPERVLVLTAEGAWRFELDHLVPAWTLWVGAAPAVQEGLDGRGPALLAALDREQRQREAARESAARRLMEALRGRLVGPRPGQEADPETIRAEAIRAQHAGDLVRAAELRAAVGDLGDAGRLFEQAAGRAG